MITTSEGTGGGDASNKVRGVARSRKSDQSNPPHVITREHASTSIGEDADVPDHQTIIHAALMVRRLLQVVIARDAPLLDLFRYPYYLAH